jgi:hypothetical protein
MVYWRHARLYKGQVIPRAKSWNDVLPASGLLDHLIIRIRTKNYTNGYDLAKNQQFEHMTNISIKSDGKEPFFDATGVSTLAAYCLNTGKMFPGVLDVMSANYQQIEYIPCFGRQPFDGRMALNLAKAGEARIGVTNDLLTTDYDSSADIELEIDGWFLEDPLTAPSGFLQTYEHSTKTWNANSQKHTFKVPPKDRVRRILFAAEAFRSSGTGAQSDKAWRNLRYLKYTHRSGKLVLQDLDLYLYDQDTLWGYPDEIETFGMGESRTGYTFDTLLARPRQVVASPSYSSDPGATSDFVIDQRVERFLAIRRSTQAGIQFRWAARGYGILDHICLHEDDPDDPSRYIDPKALQDVEVEVGNSTSGGSTGTIRFIVNAYKTQA